MCGGDEESGKKYGSWTDRGGQKGSSLRYAGRRRSAFREREKNMNGKEGKPRDENEK